MSDFPQLKTGAVVQYPAERERHYATRALRFVDGNEQRYREYPNMLRRWQIRLDLLDESEAARLENFFRTSQGAAGTFTFTDPWTGVAHVNCSFETEELAMEYLGPQRGRTSVVVKENRS